MNPPTLPDAHEIIPAERPDTCPVCQTIGALNGGIYDCPKCGTGWTPTDLPLATEAGGGEWLPIEQASKDKEFVTVKNDHGWEGMARWSDNKNEWCSPEGVVLGVTHFRSLSQPTPTPPASPSAETGRPAPRTDAHLLKRYRHKFYSLPKESIDPSRMAEVDASADFARTLESDLASALDREAGLRKLAAEFLEAEAAYKPYTGNFEQLVAAGLFVKPLEEIQADRTFLESELNLARIALSTALAQEAK